MTTADQILAFYKSLAPEPLPAGIEAMVPYANPATWQLVKQFYQKYYADQKRRILMIGINPGRLGGGITGIPFTDPFALETHCGIANGFDKKQELSSQFMYKVMEKLGGAGNFYNRIFFTAVSPIGFTANGKNLNYYDSQELTNSWYPKMVAWLEHQTATFGIKAAGIVIGTGKNHALLEKINADHKLFDQLIVLPHPRWVMQYNLKKIDYYIDMYISALEKVNHLVDK